MTPEFEDGKAIRRPAFAEPFVDTRRSHAKTLREFFYIEDICGVERRCYG